MKQISKKFKILILIIILSMLALIIWVSFFIFNHNNVETTIANNQQQMHLKFTPPKNVLDCPTIYLSISEEQEIVDKTNQIREEQNLDPNSTLRLLFELEATYKINKTPACKDYFNKELASRKANIVNSQTQATTTPPVITTDLSRYIVRVACADSNKDSPSYSLGSGTIFGPNKVIMTNAHVTKGMALCTIGLTDNIKIPPSRWYKATFEPSSSSLDITILTPSQPLPQDAGSILNGVCNPDDINLGDKVIVLGYPGIGGNTITETEGIVSGFDGYMVKTSAKIEHGNSGGGAFLEKKNCWFGIPSASVAGELESLGLIINFSMLHQQINQ